MPPATIGLFPSLILVFEDAEPGPSQELPVFSGSLQEQHKLRQTKVHLELIRDNAACASPKLVQ